VDWSDGWVTQNTCEEKAVVFETTVTVTSEECYYNAHIVGTSSDGSTSGYSWDIYKYTTYSGVGPPTGSTTLLWESPQGIDQQDKNLCFTSTGWYKIEGFVHGTGDDTSDYYDLSVDEVCVTSGISDECTLVIWNGTGEDDVGGDWNRGGEGSEEIYAKYEGTNGLDASNFTDNKTIEFTSGTDIDIGNYDLLAMWVNIKNWTVGDHVEVQFQGPGGWLGSDIYLDAYLNKSITNIWQRVFIPFVDMELTTASIYVHKLRLRSTGSVLCADSCL
jgi:hypothetical protein